MKSKSSLIIKIIGLILVLVLMVVLVFLSGRQSKNSNSNNDDNESISDNNDEQLDNSSEQVTSEQERNRLVNVTNTNTYFLLKKCVNSYYSSIINENSLAIIDDKAKDEIDVKQIDILPYKYIPEFSIDKIYKQEIDWDQDMYVIYYRTENGNSYKDAAIIIRMDTENQTFSVYPYEYLKKKNYLDLKENDTIDTENLKEIQTSSLNTYTEISDIDIATYVTELFTRYKFDLQFDNEKLYENIVPKYKQEKFNTFEEFKNYINENKSTLYKEQVTDYKRTKYDNYIEIIGNTNQNRNYVFYVSNIMNYTIELDDYSVMSENKQDNYIQLLPQSKAKYCIDRVIEAINNKDYDFIYDRLNPILKSNYYSNKEDFIKFINQNFFNNNSYEIDEDYQRISSNVYQFNVKINNEEAEEFSYNWVKMSITLNDDTDFTVSIVKK